VPWPNFVSRNKTLQSLSATSNNITDVGFASIGRALQSNSSLEELNLAAQNGSVRVRGIRALLDGVRVHPTLTSTFLPPAATNVQKKIELQFYLDRNKYLRPLLSTTMPLGLWPLALLERADDYRRDKECVILSLKLLICFTFWRQKVRGLVSRLPDKSGIEWN
jgi:hypothetical protein